jgi:hypothetical protein
LSDLLVLWSPYTFVFSSLPVCRFLWVLWTSFIRGIMGVYWLLHALRTVHPYQDFYSVLFLKFGFCCGLVPYALIALDFFLHFSCTS